MPTIAFHFPSLLKGNHLISFFCTELRGLELQTGYFSLRHIKSATGNFDVANKIGEGGFGPVYKVRIVI